jgi:hypothetical protein
MKLSLLITTGLLFIMMLYSFNIRCQSVDPNAILINRLNGKKGVYRTYEDFLQGKSENLKFVKWIFHHDADRQSIGLKVKFKNADGKTVTYSCADFWGIIAKAGFYRTFPCADGVSESICYFLSYQNDGYFIWDAASPLHVASDLQALYTSGISGHGIHFDVKKEQPSFLGAQCRLKAFGYPGKYLTNWDAIVNNIQMCKSIKLMLYYKHNGSASAPAWKYVAVNP